MFTIRRLVKKSDGAAQTDQIESKIMICLIGEQPAPNLLPIRSLRPQTVVLISTLRTEYVSHNLRNLLESNHCVIEKSADAYDLPNAQVEISQIIKDGKWNSKQIVFNLTGGTKPMSLAAYRIAQEINSTITYLQSEGGKSLLYIYNWHQGSLRLEERREMKNLLTIDDFLKAYGLGNYFTKTNNNQNQKGEIFEMALFQALLKICDEVKHSIRFSEFSHVELDLIFRIGNQIGVAEAKTGGEAGKKSSIDQLNSPTHREFLGTYTKKFLFLQGEISKNNRKLIDAYRINALELNSPLISNELNDIDFELLKNQVTNVLGR